MQSDSWLRTCRAAAAICLGLLIPARADDWPQFRGPRGDGTAEARNLPTAWGGFGGVTWQTEIPGRGWSSPIVVGGRVWLTAAESLALPTEDRKRKLEQGLYKDFQEQFQAHSSVTLYAIELDVKSGELLRNIELFTASDPAPIHATNTYASPTPATDGQRLFCHFGSLGTVAMDPASGQVLWKERFQLDDITGPGSSPVLWKDRLILACDGADQQFVIALDKLSGKPLWKTPRPKIDAEGKHRRAFSTPLVVEHAGQEQVIVPGAQWVCAYEPASGAELWRASFGDGHATIPRPVYQNGLVYICTGYLKPQLWAIRIDGRGDVTETHVAWRYEKQVPEISSPIVVGDGLYFVSSLGVLTCLDAKSGRQHFQQRLGGNYAASPIAADGKLYFTSQEGVTTVVKPGLKYEELGRSQLIGQTMASPAIAGEALLIRADRMLYCVGKP
ncbi:MAG: PQQ-like beta-propeller repeat protein [Planctomycetaceae bacterium]|nr:PQQ-like beta-propeller repeat protein [Planctomycetaceae bacterium]